MDDSRPPLPGQSEDHDENQPRNSGQSVGHADQLRRLRCRQSLSADWRWKRRTSAGAPKGGGGTECQPELPGPRVGSRDLPVGPEHDTINFLQTVAILGIHQGRQGAPGEYFGRQRLPFYNIPNPTNDPDAPIKIPSGANIFPQSPIKNVHSSYGNAQWQNDKYMLSSGGTGPIEATIGWAGGTPDERGSTTLHLTRAEPNKIDFIAKNYLVKGVPPGSPPRYPIPSTRAPPSRTWIKRRGRSP